ncbi:MAG: alpha/beta hydrolase [Pseudomonadales bacterium]|nr:alpha/beta hydrolase [Pseudomonadales bacterium]MCP5358628.1 alpha/beta hydrolase [Pseudomonadales bacterium]
MKTLFLPLLLSLGLLASSSAWSQPPATLLGGACSGGPDAPLTEAASGRTFVLDYPCDLKPGEDVTVILNLHGAGSNERYQRAYFPAWELKEKYRLVIATPHSPVRRWSQDDDAYLQAITDAVINAVGQEHVKAFWLVGHSQGGLTSRRLVCTPFFADKVDGFVSLSGGRLGGAAERSPGAGRPVQADAPPPRTPGAPATASISIPSEPGCDFSHIYETGEHEIVSLPTTSTRAEQLHCAARVRQEDVIDTEAGRTYDSGSQNPGTREWGLLPRPGTAQVYEYPGCANGRVVADIVRLDKGHTEGLEPMITERIIGLMTR